MSHTCDPTCADCARRDRQHGVLRVALTADDELDDIKRAQIWSRIEPRIAAPAARAPRWWLPAAALVGLAAAALVVMRGGSPAPRAFVAPADTTLSLRLDHVHAALIGPAQLDVRAPDPKAPTSTTLELHGGTLLAELEGGQGRGLRVVAPGATIDVIGTLFAVELDAGVTCVSVAHGTVRMTTATRALMITGGERACSDLRPPAAIDSAMQRALTRLEATITAERDDLAPAPAVAAAPATPPPGPSSPSSHPAPALAARPTPTPSPSPSALPSAAPRPTIAPSAPHVDQAAPRAPTTMAETTTPAPAMTTAAPAPAPPPPPPPPAPPTTSSRVAIEAHAPAEPAPPAAPAPTATSLYRDAEAALAAHDLALADQHLATLLTEFPESALLDQVLYERARIAHRRHAWADAQRQLDRLATITASPLAEPGAYLSCRIAFEAGDGSAESCLVRYRARYPDAPHGLDLLGMLTELAFRAGGCRAAQPRLVELSRAFATSEQAQRWQQRCPVTP